MMIKLCKRLHMWMGQKPLSLTAYLSELERGIWEQTNNLFLEKKNPHSSSFQWDLPLSSTRAEQMPGWIKTDSLISCCAPPLPAFAVTHTMVTALSVQDLTLTFLDLQTGSQEGHEPKGLTELRGFNSPLQTRQGGGVGQRETQWNTNRSLAQFYCNAGWHMRGCCTYILQHSSSKIKFDVDSCTVFWLGIHTTIHFWILVILPQKALRW